MSLPADSLQLVPDRFIMGLLPEEIVRTLPALAGVSGAAFESYMRGVAAFQKDRFREAIQEFSEALDADSTFALAAIRSINAGCALGAGTNAAWLRGAKLAWSFRENLSMRDRDWLIALVGPDYPEVPLRVRDICP